MSNQSSSMMIPVVIAAIVAFVAASAVVLIPKMRASKPNETVGTPSGIVDSGATSGETIIPGQPPEILADMKILPFQLINHDGLPVDETMFDGKVTIMDFFFTRCPGPCPQMTSELRRIQQSLDGTGVRIVSFSVDADHDGPVVMRQYAHQNNADLATWTFVTGDPDQVANLAIDGLGFALQQAEPSPDAPTDGPNILHPTHFMLVGPDRRILAIARSNDAEHVDLLVAGARRLAESLDGG